jgi:hypothetical protein
MDALQSSLLIIGSVSVIAAIVGGNLKLPGAQFGPLESTSLRVILAAVGVLLIAGSLFPFAIRLSLPTKQSYLAQLDASCEQLGRYQRNVKTPPFDDIDAQVKYGTHRLSFNREFAAQWRRWAIPPGDEKEVTAMQNLYDTYLDKVQEGIDQLQKRGYISHDLLPELTKLGTAYSARMRRYGSNTCVVYMTQ